MVGGNPTALAIATLAGQTGFDTHLVRPFGPQTSPFSAVFRYHRGDVLTSVATVGLDRWTAVVVSTHDDDEIDDAVIQWALSGNSGYIGVLGASKKVTTRAERLEKLGFEREAIARLHVPIGAARCGKSPWEIAVSVLAEIMQYRNNKVDGQGTWERRFADYRRDVLDSREAAI